MFSSIIYDILYDRTLSLISRDFSEFIIKSEFEVDISKRVKWKIIVYVV